MQRINKENIKDFLEKYHYLHDSYILNIDYDFNKSQIEILFDVFWSGKPTLKLDGTYETNKIKLKVLCKDIKQYNYKDIYDDFISEAYLKYVKLENEEYLCLATDKDTPEISVVCKEIEYEEIN